MSGSRLALVAEDQNLAGAIQAHLKKTLGHQAFLCNFNSIRDHLGRDTDGLLLLASSSPTDAENILRLVQEITLQKLPPIIMILEGDRVPSPALNGLEPYIARRLRWPTDANSLSQLVKDRCSRGMEFTGTRCETLEEVLRRRLLAQTPSLLPLVERIALAAAHDVTVLLNGETGTGKTFLARLIHEHSPRKKNRFLAVPCGAIATNLVES